MLSQTYQDFELLVVDDCSKDDSLQLIKQKAQSDSRIRVIALEKNAGVANARNVGIREAKGKYIALLDNDDLWTADKLERQLTIAEKGADIVYCSYDFIDEQNNEIKKPFIVPKLRVNHEFDIFGQIEFYESLWDGVPSVYKDYGKTKANVLSLKPYIDAHASEKVLTHTRK